MNIEFDDYDGPRGPGLSRRQPLPRFGVPPPRPHPFLISIRGVARRLADGDTVTAHVAQVIDRETSQVVYETAPQRDELDARVVAGLWIERQESGE